MSKEEKLALIFTYVATAIFGLFVICATFGGYYLIYLIIKMVTKS